MGASHLTCPACSRAVAHTDNFCSACGHALSGAATPSPPVVARNAFATIMFLDVKGSSTMIEGLDPEAAADAQRLAECLESAKTRLSAMHRELIHLRHELALSYKQIATKLGRTIGYVSGTLARAERYLREEVIDACADHLGSFRSLF